MIEFYEKESWTIPYRGRYERYEITSDIIDKDEILRLIRSKFKIKENPEWDECWISDFSKSDKNKYNLTITFPYLD